MATKIAFIGTSITLGVRAGVIESDTFAYKIVQGRGIFDGGYINAGVGGNKSDQMLARFYTDVIAKNPTHVCIEVPHINDHYAGYSVFQTEYYIGQMVVAALAAGLKTTVIDHQLVRETGIINAMPPRLEASVRLGNVRGVAAHVCCYLGFIGRYFITNGGPTFDALYAMNGAVSDPQHPSAAGHSVMANDILANPRACAL